MSLLLTAKRRIVQWASLVLLTSNLWGFSAGRFCLPVLHCEACAWSWLGCPIGVMSAAIAFHEFPWLAVGLVAGVAVLVGRFFCGWICPTGLAQDLLYKIPAPKFALPRPLAWLKYAVLLVSVVLAAYFFGKEHLAFFCNLCPTAAIEVVVPQLIMTRDFAFDAARILRFAILGALIVLAIGNHRSFCKLVCPIGAMVALGNKLSWLRIGLNATTCVHCMKCNAACPMEIPVESCSRTGRAINRDPECIECLNCQQACPVNAITNNTRVLTKE
jgi:ferredoxin-type protein NapH